jgi:selenocysteine-specific elongation factor
LKQRLECIDNREKFCAYLIASSDTPKSVRNLCAETGLFPERVKEFASKAVQRGEAVALKPDDGFISARVFQDISKKLERHIQTYVTEHPALGAIERPELKRRLEKDTDPKMASYFDDILNAMKQCGAILLNSNDVSLPGGERKLEGATAAQAQQLEAAFLNGGLTPPSRAEVEAQLKIPQKSLREILKYLRDTGKLVDASTDVTFHRTHVEEAKTRLKELFALGPQRTTSEIRQHLGMNRKFAVPLVELLDKEKFTVRNGDFRQLL